MHRDSTKNWVECIGFSRIFKRKINFEFSFENSVKLHGDVTRLGESSTFSRLLTIFFNRQIEVLRKTLG